MTRISAAILLVCVCGCAAHSDPIATNQQNVIFFIPGAAGNFSTQKFFDGLHAGEITYSIQIVEWGAPPALFAMNFSDSSIHQDAEWKLFTEIETWRADHPKGRIDIIAHSAGAGVTLGALRRLDRGVRVDTVVLLAPSVSPNYELRGSLAHMTGTLHVFYSDRDDFFLSWRTGNFGTYDGEKSRAAGNCGFDLSSLPSYMQKRVQQHAYDPAWRKYGNDGGHGGSLTREFAREIIAPLLK